MLTRPNSRLSNSNQRDYDPWGNIRGGAATGDPKGRYCASLGHKQDDESGLVYMRARYYEPGSGRFVSEDPSLQGPNWFGYCSGDPVDCIDESGCSQVWSYTWYGCVGSFAYGLCLTLCLCAGALAVMGQRAAAVATLEVAAAAAAVSLLGTGLSSDAKAVSTILRFIINNKVLSSIVATVAGAMQTAVNVNWIGGLAVALNAAYTISIVGVLAYDLMS